MVKFYGLHKPEKNIRANLTENALNIILSARFDLIINGSTNNIEETVMPKELT
jgi:hypothetical protein